MNSTPKETGGRPCRLRGVALFPLHLKRQCPGGTFLDLLRDRFCARGFEVDPGSLLQVEDGVKSAQTDARVDADARIETYDDGVVPVLLNRIFHRPHLSAFFVQSSTDYTVSGSGRSVFH